MVFVLNISYEFCLSATETNWWYVNIGSSNGWCDGQTEPILTPIVVTAWRHYATKG